MTNEELKEEIIKLTNKINSMYSTVKFLEEDKMALFQENQRLRGLNEQKN